MANKLAATSQLSCQVALSIGCSYNLYHFGYPQSDLYIYIINAQIAIYSYFLTRPFCLAHFLAWPVKICLLRAWAISVRIYWFSSLSPWNTPIGPTTTTIIYILSIGFLISSQQSEVWLITCSAQRLLLYQVKWQLVWLVVLHVLGFAN